MPNSYWATRTARNEAYAHKMATSYAARLSTLHKNVYNKINTYLEALQADIDAGVITSRTQLWQSKKYINLLNEIRTQTGRIQTAQQKIVEDCLQKVFNTTMGRVMSDFGKTWDTQANTALCNQIINRVWEGSDFSSRIWKNTNALAERLQSDMSDMILTGNRNKVTKQLAHDMGVSYHEAERLVVTESAHVYTEASKEGYRQNGISEVVWLAEDDSKTCDICSQYSGKRWAVDKAPQLPMHCFADAVLCQ